MCGGVCVCVCGFEVLLGAVRGLSSTLGFDGEPTPLLCQFLSPPMQESSGIKPVAY